MSRPCWLPLQLLLLCGCSSWVLRCSGGVTEGLANTWNTEDGFRFALDVAFDAVFNMPLAGKGTAPNGTPARLIMSLGSRVRCSPGTNPRHVAACQHSHGSGETRGKIVAMKARGKMGLTAATRPQVGPARAICGRGCGPPHG